MYVRDGYYHAMLLSNISWAISDLEMITDFSNKVLKNSWKEVMFIYM